MKFGFLDCGFCVESFGSWLGDWKSFCNLWIFFLLLLFLQFGGGFRDLGFWKRLTIAMVLPGKETEFWLESHSVIPRGKPFLLVVLDGWGENKEDEYNAIYKANCPTIKALRTGAPRRWRTIKAHGTAVGLPSDGDMGNSEVGHNAMGAGKIIQQG